MVKEQKRAVNFTAKEETILISLVKKYSKIVECKQSDTHTNKQKAECWKAIEKEFNSISGECYRNDKIFKKKYDNLKKRTKRKFADEKANIFGTGGGPEETIKMTNTDMYIREILGTRIEGNSSEFDSDVTTAAAEDVQDIVQASNNDIDISIQEIDYNSNDDTDKENTSTSSRSNLEQVACSSNPSANQNHDWSKYTPKMLRTKKSKALITPRTDGGIPRPRRYQSDTTIAHRVSQWAEAKEAIELMRQDAIKKEEEFKLQALKEKHQLEMDFMKRKADIELEHMQKEHEAKMEVIRLPLKK